MRGAGGSPPAFSPLSLAQLLSPYYKAIIPAVCWFDSDFRDVCVCSQNPSADRSSAGVWHTDLLS